MAEDPHSGAAPTPPRYEDARVDEFRRAHRPQHYDGPIVRAWAWTARSAHGIRPWLLLLVALTVLGFCMFVSTLADRNAARDLQAHRQWVIAHDVQVDVETVTGRGGGYHQVDQVRVRFDGDIDPVELEALNAANANSIYPDEHPEVHDGWQAPTPVTGYEPPLSVRVQRDANGAVVAAMAQVDYDYWTIDNSDPEAGLSMTLIGASLAGISLWANAARLRRRDRRWYS